MKKLLPIFIFLLTKLFAVDIEPVQGPLSCEEPEKPASDCCCLMTNRQLCCNEILLEAKAAWYYPTSSCFRSMYSSGNGIYSLEANFQFANHWYAYTSGSFFISGEGDSTYSIWFIPVTVGVKYLRHHIAFNYLWSWYVGVGGVATYVQIQDHDPGYETHINRLGGGGNTQLGGIWYITKHFLVDIFAQYTFNYIPTSDETCGDTANLSGLSLGGGIGWTF